MDDEKTLGHMLFDALSKYQSGSSAMELPSWHNCKHKQELESAAAEFGAELVKSIGNLHRRVTENDKK